MNKIPIIFLIFNLIIITFNISGEDIIKYEKGQSLLDVRILYKKEIISEALNHTVDKYGPYRITTDAPIMNSRQAMKQLKTGKKLNVFIAMSNPEWESNTIPIRIPIRRGLLSYRLLLINKKDLNLYKNIETLNQLKLLTVGMQNVWSTTEILKASGFNVVTGTSYDGLFLMLNNNRFNFLPRGVNEIYGELEQRKEKLKNVMIEPNLALYIPSPTYIFVSPEYPEIANRLEEGLELMIQDGTLDEIFHKYYDADIKKADLDNRIIIKIDNPYLTHETPLDRIELWFNPIK